MDGRPCLCMVVHGFYPLDPRVARAARAARDVGWHVEVVAMRRPGELGHETVEGVEVTRLPLMHRRGRGVVRSIVEYGGFTIAAATVLAARSALKRYDVVHVHNPPDFLVVAALAPKLRGAKIILDIHDLVPDMLDMRFHGRIWAPPVERLLLRTERAAAQVADAVVTVHEPYRLELARRGVPLEKITVVMNTVDESVLPPDRNHRGESFRIVYHGTIAPHYGVDLLVEATALIQPLVPNARLEIYGDGDAVPDVRRLADELGIGDRVFVSQERVEQSIVLEQVAGASVGVVPNRPTRLNRFALSSKLFEYVVLGIPAVSADLPTIRAHFDENEVTFFAAANAESLAAALTEVATDSQTATQKANAAKRRYDEQYTWTTSAARYISVIEGITGRRRG